MKKKLNIGMIGYGFMGRTHSNAFRTAPNFFDLPYEPVLKTVCARNALHRRTHRRRNYIRQTHTELFINDNHFATGY